MDLHRALLLHLVLGITLSSASECHDSYRHHPGDLVGTMSATRSAYQAWRHQQHQALAQVTFGQWSLRAGDTARPVDLPDNEIVSWRRIDTKNHDQACLQRRLTAASACVLTLGFGGANVLRISLNGEELLAAPSAEMGRIGTNGDHQWDPVLDRFLVDLPLRAGINELRLEVQFFHPRRRVLACTTTVHPVQRYWDWLIADFPPSRYRLLAAMPATWFGNDVLAPTKERRDSWSQQARHFRTTTPELQEGRDHRFLWQPPVAESRKPGLLHDGWFDARDHAFERDLLTEWAVPLPPLAASDRTWLVACADAAQRAHVAQKLARLRQAIDALAAEHATYPAPRLQRAVDALAGELAAIEPLDAAAVARCSLAALQREALITCHPLLAGQQLLFVTRHTYQTHHIYDDHNHGAVSFAGNIHRLDLASGQAEALFPQLAGGLFDRYDLHFDGQGVVFGYRRPHQGGYRLHEAALDGSSIRQLTHAPADEAERIRRHSEYTPAELAADPLRHAHWTDDVMPCYLPDGGIAFVSTRPEYSIFCGPHETTSTVLHRIESDGSGLHQLSRSPLSELFPTLDHTGRIMYTRYEYVYKGNMVVHPIWRMRPDGSGGEEVYGDNIALPAVFAHARAVPGRNDRIAAIGCSHEPYVNGTLLMIDTTIDRRDPAAMHDFTPEIDGYSRPRKFRNGRWVGNDCYGPACMDPYPLDENFVLVAYNQDSRIDDPAGYGIWLIDRFGNRVPVHHEDGISCFQPMLLQPRERPPVLPALERAHIDPPPARSGLPEQKATLILADATRGLPGVEPGSVRHLRIYEQVPRTWDATNRLGKEYYPGSATAISHGGHIWVAVDHGLVPVAADGSAHFTVPADRNLFFQALDADYRAIQTMRTFINMQPGEVRSCVGCHDDRNSPRVDLGALAALRRPASRSAPPPGVVRVPRPLHYPSDIQPILDRNCVSCHQGADAAGDLILDGAPDYLFSRSYMNLMERGFVSVIEEHQVAWWRNSHGIFQRFAGMEHAPVIPPYHFGAHASRLSTILDDQTHAGLLTREERLAIDTWMDTNGQFWGSYFGHRDEAYAHTPGYRLVPDLATAQGHPPFLVHPMPTAP